MFRKFKSVISITSLSYISFFICSMIGCILMALAIGNKINFLLGVIASIGWFSATIAIFVGWFFYEKRGLQETREKIDILNSTNDSLKKANEALKRAYGYRKDLDDNVSIYSQMLGSGINVSTTNAIVVFAQNLKPTDSVFLIKVDNEDKNWFFHVAGNAIHIKTAEWVLETVIEKCKETASHDSLIWAPKNIIN